MADTARLKWAAERHGGSSPSAATSNIVMKIWELTNSNPADIRYSMMFCLVRSIYFDLIGPQWESDNYLNGAIHYLDLLTTDIQPW